MNYKEYFAPYAIQTNRFLAKFFAHKRKTSQKTTLLAARLWQSLEEFSQGGKRIRAGLVKLGYESAGGKNPAKILPVSAAIEILHASLLVHDDIIDQDEIRHSRPTVYKVYEAYHKKYYKMGSALHYGESIGIMVGDIGLYEVINLILGSDFAESYKVRAVKRLVETTINTAYGEALDVDLSYRHTKQEKDIFTVYKLKTAFYTFIGPLKMGAIAAGEKNGLARFELYGLPAGIAFQLQDDILGIFGDEEKTGKPVDSDIKEGKNTLLYTQAIKNANAKQKERLNKLWGNKEISDKDVDEVRKTIVDTGSLAYSKQEARKLADRAIAAIPKVTRNRHLQEVYETLANYIVERES